MLSQVEGCAMLSKCANPKCSEQFRYLHQGRLFCLTPTPEVQATNYGSLEFLCERFWLCDRCAKQMRVVWDGLQARVEQQPSTIRPRLQDTSMTTSGRGTAGFEPAIGTHRPQIREAAMAIAELKAEKLEEVNPVFHSILAATDFSEGSDRALRVAMHLAEHYKARFSVAHVFQSDWRHEKREHPPEVELEADVEQELRTSIQRLHLTGKIDSVLTDRGPVLEGVLAILARCGADLLVIGTRARGGFSKIALGSAAEELVRLAECSVITVGPQAETRHKPELHTVLFATDFGAGSTKLLPRVMTLSKRERAKLVVLHTTSPMPVTSTSLSAYSPGIAAVDELRNWEGSSRKQTLQRLQKWVAPHLHPGDSEPEYVVGTEFLAEDVLSTAGRLKADLIAMGANRSASARWAAHFPWSAVHEVIHAAPCPVMTMAA